MKFLLWLFNFAGRHRRDIRRYEKGTKSSRIVAIVMMLIFTAITIWLEFLTFRIFENSFLWGIVCAVFTLACILTTSETAGVYAYCEFKYYALGTVGKKLSRYAIDRGNETLGEVIESNTSERSHKKMDLAVGIIGTIIAVGVIVSVVTILLLKINGALMTLQ